jgi:hypothetical protein
MKTLLATHIARFDSAYNPRTSMRIMRYLRTRAKDFKVEFPTLAKPKGKGKTKGKSSPSPNGKRAYGGTQRSWNITEQHIQVATPCTTQRCIDMNMAHTHSIDSCRNKFSRLASFSKRITWIQKVALLSKLNFFFYDWMSCLVSGWK